MTSERNTYTGSATQTPNPAKPRHRLDRESSALLRWLRTPHTPATPAPAPVLPDPAAATTPADYLEAVYARCVALRDHIGDLTRQKNRADEETRHQLARQIRAAETELYQLGDQQ